LDGEDLQNAVDLTNRHADEWASQDFGLDANDYYRTRIEEIAQGTHPLDFGTAELPAQVAERAPEKAAYNFDSERGRRKFIDDFHPTSAKEVLLHYLARGGRLQVL
jgi:hypothetical protein